MHESKAERFLPITSSKEAIFKFVKNTNELCSQRRERVAKQLDSILADTPPCCMSITTTGSDGRCENKTFDSRSSNIEYTALIERDIAKVVANRILEKIQLYSSWIIDRREVKSLESDSLCIVGNSKDLVFPTRIWDSFLLWWDHDLYNESRRAVSEEILANPKIAQRFKDRLDYHKRVLRNGYINFKGISVPEFSIQGDRVYFWPVEKGSEIISEWFKSGPLRVVQYSLAYALLRKIQDSKTHPLFVQELPQNIVSRLDYLRDAGLTTHSAKTIEELSYIYGYFLKIHHEIQYRHMLSDGEETQFYIDPNDASDIREMLVMLQSLCDPRKFY